MGKRYDKNWEPNRDDFWEELLTQDDLVNGEMPDENQEYGWVI